MSKILPPFILLTAFFQPFYRPDIIGIVLFDPFAEKKIIAQESGSSKIRFKKPPLVEFLNTKEILDMTLMEEINIKAKISEQGGGISEFRLFHNGKLVSTETRGLKATKNKVMMKDYAVQLLSGENVFRLTAFNDDRIESNPVEFKLNYSGIQATSDMYILAIRINRYQMRL